MTQKPFKTADVLLLSFAHFIHDVYTSFLSPLLPLIIERLSITLGQAGLLSTMLQLPSLFNPMIGFIADRKGLARWLVILAPSATAVPMSLVGIAPSYWLLFLLLFMAGTSVALFHVPAPVLVARVSGDKKGRGMSFFMTGGETARTLGPFIAVGLVSYLGLANMAWIMIPALLTSVMLYLRLSDLSNSQGASRPAAFSAVFRRMKGTLLPLAGALSARAFMHSAMAVFLPVLIERQTGNLWLAGSALAVYEAFGVLGVLLSGTLSDTLGRRKVLALSLMLAPASLFLFMTTTGIVRALALFATGFTLLASTPVMLAIVQENAGDSPAAANGLFMMISFVVRSLTIVLVGFLGDALGLETTFLICAGLGFGAVPAIFMLKTEPASRPQ